MPVCLDGTLPGYHLDRGFGSGANSWLVHLEVKNVHGFIPKFLGLINSTDYGEILKFEVLFNHVNF